MTDREKAIEIVREALKTAVRNYKREMQHAGIQSDSCERYSKAIDALDSLADEPSKDARETAAETLRGVGQSAMRNGILAGAEAAELVKSIIPAWVDTDRHRAAAYITAYVASLRAEALREAADRAARFVQSKDCADEGEGDHWTIAELRAAILSNEPKETSEVAQRKADERAYKWRHDMMGDDDDAPSEDARELVHSWWCEWMDSTGPDNLHRVCVDKLASLITARDELVRAKERKACAERTVVFVVDSGWCVSPKMVDSLRAAIMGTEVEG